MFSGFCNPADVEAFTEEKKDSLLGKRHGKGADFVRAAHEIIEVYEDLKIQGQGTNVHSRDEGTNVSNSVESLGDSEVKDDAPQAIIRACPESTDSTKVKYGDELPTEETAAAIEKDALHDKDVPPDNPKVNMVVSEPPQPATYSRKRLGVLKAQTFVTQKRLSFARRSRSSSRMDSRRFEKLIMPLGNISNGAVNEAPYKLRDASSRRSKRIKKSPEEVSDLGSPVSNGSLEENGSGIVTGDSDTRSFNEGSTVESGYGLAKPDSVVECSEGDAELSQRLEFNANSVIIKKKRKPSKKRANSSTAEVTEPTYRLEKDPVSVGEVHKYEQASPNNGKNMNGKYCKDDGDEHLPLLKRARVRMGRPSSTEERKDSSVQPDEKSSEVLDSQLGRLCSFSNSEEDGLLDRSSSVVVVDLNNSLAITCCPLNNQGGCSVESEATLPVNKPAFREIKKQCSVDGEAALPPSKRIHRALEAMSANVAEDGQATAGAASSLKTFMNTSCFSALGDCSKASLENKAKNELGLHNLGSASKNAARCSTNKIPSAKEASYVKVVAQDATVICNNSTNITSCVDIKDVDASTDCRSSDMSILGGNAAKTVVLSRSPKCSSPMCVRKQSDLECDHGLDDLSPSPKEDLKIENCKLEDLCAEEGPSELSVEKSRPVSANVEIHEAPTQSDTCVAPSVSPRNCGAVSLKIAVDEDKEDTGM